MALASDEWKAPERESQFRKQLLRRVEETDDLMGDAQFIERRSVLPY